MRTSFFKEEDVKKTGMKTKIERSVNPARGSEYRGNTVEGFKRKKE